MPTFDEAETLVQSRKLADGIMKELEATMPRPVPPPPPSERIEPEELLPQPPPSLPPASWSTSMSTTLPLAASPAVLKKTPRERRRRTSRSHLHWAVLAMSAAIAVGLWRDPVARANAARQLRAESSRVVAKLPPVKIPKLTRR